MNNKADQNLRGELATGWPKSNNNVEQSLIMGTDNCYYKHRWHLAIITMGIYTVDKPTYDTVERKYLIVQNYFDSFI